MNVDSYQTTPATIKAVCAAAQMQSSSTRIIYFRTKQETSAGGVNQGVVTRKSTWRHFVHEELMWQGDVNNNPEIQNWSDCSAC